MKRLSTSNTPKGLREEGSHSDLLIRGGTLVCIDAEDQVLRTSIRVRGDRIIAIGRSAERGRARVIDASGCLVMPGFVQAHVHLCQALFRGMADDLPLLDWLRERIWPLEAAHDASSMRASAELGIAEMLLGGTTSILDMGSVHHQEQIFRTMKRSGIRGFSGKAMMDRGRGVPRGLKESTRQSVETSRSLCRDWHGAAAGRIGYAYAPRFILSCSESLMRQTANAAREDGVLIHTHAAEHRAERQAVKEQLGLDDIAALEKFGIYGPQAVLAHGVQLRAAEIRRMSRLGTRIAHCPSANLKLASGIAPLAEMLEAGLVVGIGSDGAPCNNRMDPWTEMRQAALLSKAKRGDAASLPARQALRLATMGGATALGLQDSVGSLEVGKKADIVIVSAQGLHQQPALDPHSTLVYASTAQDVQHVLVDGAWLVRHRELTTLDGERIAARARSQGKKAMKRAGL